MHDGSSVGTIPFLIFFMAATGHAQKDGPPGFTNYDLPFLETLRRVVHKWAKPSRVIHR
jgi:hypothetical protein